MTNRPKARGTAAETAVVNAARNCPVCGSSVPRPRQTYCSKHCAGRAPFIGQSREASLSRRLWSRIERDENGCWVWTGAFTHRGYGVIWDSGRQEHAHRAAYWLAHGDLPSGLDIDHLCRNRACCNPEHLEAVPRAENLRRARAARGLEDACGKGHPRSVENVYMAPDGTTHCRPCRAEYARAYYARKVAS